MNKAVTKYASDLIGGMRLDGKSIVECCLIWGITEKEFNSFLTSNEELQKAHEIGDMQCAAWWHKNYRNLAENGNASALTFGMKNISKVSWMDKPDIKEESDEPLRAISITILPPRAVNDNS